MAGCTTPSEPLAAGDREICGLFRISEVEGLALPEGISERRAPRFVTDGGTCTVDGPGGTGVLVITIDHPGSHFEEMASDNRWQREDYVTDGMEAYRGRSGPNADDDGRAAVFGPERLILVAVEHTDDMPEPGQVAGNIADLIAPMFNPA